MPVNSKGGSVNSFDDDGDFGLSELGRLAEQNEREPASFRELRLRARNARVSISAINQMEEHSPGSTQIPLYQKLLSKQKRVKSQLEPRMALYKVSMRERLNTQAVNTIGREFSESRINSYVSGSMNSQEAQVAGMAMAQRPYNDLAQQRSAILNQMGGLRQDSMAAAGEYIQGRGVNPNAAGAINENAAKMKELANQLVPITIAMSQLKQQGLDPQGRQRQLIQMGDRAAGVLSYNKLEEEMRSGKGLGSLSDAELRKKETEAAQKLVRALEELRDSAGKTKEELDGLHKNAEQASEEFKDMQDARRMGGNGGNGYAAGAAWATAVGQLANLVGNTIQTMGITQPLQQMGNIAGFGNLENQKYDMWRSAIGGNMTDRLNLGGWKNAAEFGATLAGRADWVVGARSIGGVAAGAAGGFQLADAVTSGPGGIASSKVLGNPQTVQSLASGAMALGEGISMAAIYGKDYFQEITSSATAIEANMSAMGATRQLNHISGYQLQQYRDYLMGLGDTAIGMGAQASPFIDKAGGSAFMTQMQGIGLSMGEFTGVANRSVQRMGSTFNADQVLRAKQWENFGLGSTQENMDRMTAFAEGGSQNPLLSLEKALGRAVGTGLDSSKALTMVAENTGQLVEKNNARGGSFDVGDAVTRLVLGAVDGNNTNREFAAKQAFATFSSEERFKTNTSSSFAGQVAVSRLQKDLGLDFNSALSLQGTSTEMWQDWRRRAAAGDVDAVELAMANQGIDVSRNGMFRSNPNAFFGTVANNKVLTQLERAGAGFATGANQDWTRMQSWLLDDPTGQRAKIFTGELSTKGQPNWVHDSRMSIVQSIRNADPNANVQQVLRDILSGIGLGGPMNMPFTQGAAFGLTQEERNRAGQQQIAAAQAGIGAFAGANHSGTTGSLVVAGTGRVAQSQGPSESVWATAAAESAKSFGASAIRLDSASGKLVQAAEKLIQWAGANKLSGDDKATREAERRLKEEIPDINRFLKERADGKKE